MIARPMSDAASHPPPPAVARSGEVPIGRYDHDDDLLAATREDGRARGRVYQPQAVSVVLGQGSKPGVEVLADACRDDGVPVLRRAGGGCAVVLDPGNVVVTAAFPAAVGLGIHRTFALLSDWLLGALAGLGLRDLHREGVSDLAYGDRKVGGACLYLPRRVMLYSVTLLCEPEVDLMERYLAHPPREPAYRRGRRHRDFVGRLADLPGGWTAKRLTAALGTGLDPTTLKLPPSDR